MFKKRDDYIYENVHTKDQLKSYLSFALILVLLISLTALLFIIVLRKEESAVFEKFVQAVQAEDYEQAMEFYYTVQERATDLKYESKDRGTYKDQQIAMEDLIGAEVDQLLDKLRTGQDLEDFEKKKLNDLKFLSSMHVIPFIKNSTESLLDGELEPEIWEARLNNFTDIDYLKDYSRDLLSQKESLFSKINDFERAGELENGANWQLTWSSWDELANDSEGSRFAREYAGFRLLSYQEREYAHLMSLAEEMITAQQYYTTYNLLSRMHEVFPERDELSERLIYTEGLIPASIVSWRGDVLVLSIRPLIVRPELAFEKSTESAYAYNALITNKEFLNILNQLYRADYVLVSPRQFAAWPERMVDLEVPAGKKPLILIFDRWQYSVLNQVAGTASRLYLDKDDQIRAQAGDVEGRDLDAIPILEDFLEDHPDFSFDGAKAVISLNTKESLFGYTVTAEQISNSQEAWSRVGETYPEVTEDELRSHRDTIGRLFKYLVEQGWDFASSGNAGFDTAALTYDELQEEIDSWSLAVNSWLPESQVFVFPNGSHVYGQEDLLKLMLSRGYNIFIGQGPKPYMFYDRRFVHLDSLAVNGNSLTAIGGYLTTILDSYEVLDHNLR